VHAFPAAYPVYSESGQRGLDDSVVFGHVTCCTRLRPHANLEHGAGTLDGGLPATRARPAARARTGGRGGMVRVGGWWSSGREAPCPPFRGSPVCKGLNPCVKWVLQQFLVKSKQASGLAFSALKCVFLDSTLPVARFRPCFEKATGEPRARKACRCITQAGGNTKSVRVNSASWSLASYESTCGGGKPQTKTHGQDHPQTVPARGDSPVPGDRPFWKGRTGVARPTWGDTLSWPGSHGGVVLNQVTGFQAWDSQFLNV